MNDEPYTVKELLAAIRSFCTTSCMGKCRDRCTSKTCQFLPYRKSSVQLTIWNGPFKEQWAAKAIELAQGKYYNNLWPSQFKAEMETIMRAASPKWYGQLFGFNGALRKLGFEIVKDEHGKNYTRPIPISVNKKSNRRIEQKWHQVMWRKIERQHV